MSEPTATYHPALDRPIDRLRYMLGDTNTAAPLLLDVTYTAALAQQANDERATALQLATGLISKYAQEATSLGSLGDSITWANRLKGWQDLVSRLRKEIDAAATVVASAFDVLRPQRPGDSDRAEYRRELGDVEYW